MKLTFILSSIIVVMMLGFTQKTQLGSDTTFDKPTETHAIIVGNIVNGEPELAPDLTAFEDKLSGLGYTEIGDYDFIYDVTPSIADYITWTGIKEGKSVIGASEIIENGSELELKPTGETHSCSSRPGCSGCKFIKLNSHGKTSIEGCECSIGDADAGCSHTVTETID